MTETPYVHKRRSLKPYLAAVVALLGAAAGVVMWRRGRV